MYIHVSFILQHTQNGIAGVCDLSGQVSLDRAFVDFSLVS